MRIGRRNVPARFLVAGTLFIVAVGALGLFLARQGRDRADAWSSRQPR
jgi:hypothetical protein